MLRLAFSTEAIRRSARRSFASARGIAWR